MTTMPTQPEKGKCCEKCYCIEALGNFCKTPNCKCHQPQDRNSLTDISQEDADKLMADGKAVAVPQDKEERWEISKEYNDCFDDNGYPNKKLTPFIRTLLSKEREKDKVGELIERCINSGGYTGFGMGWNRVNGAWTAQLKSLADNPTGFGSTPTEALENLLAELEK